jgi:hypothetical protein
MSDNNNFGFAKLVPGFDFLQNLAKGASQSMPQMPTLSNWVAPTLNVEELDKRIAELKAVQFWLEQNGRALAATIQALEVQKMTLATLQGMNMSMGELANSLKVQTTETMTNSARSVGQAAEAAASAMAGAADAVSGAARRKAGARKAEEEAAAAAAAEDASDQGAAAADGAGGKPAGGKPAGGTAGAAAPVDPLQWWGSLTQQFQQIAASAMQDVAQRTAADTARNTADGAARGAAKTASPKGKAAGGGKGGTSAAASPSPAAAPAAAPVKKAAAKKAPARKRAAKKTST